MPKGLRARISIKKDCLPMKDSNKEITLRLTDSPGDVARAAELLRAGRLVAIPTETVYGLAADALNGDAVAAIFAAKGRPQDNPLIVHIAYYEEWAPLVAGIPAAAQALAAAGLVKKALDGVKVLGNGSLTKNVTVKAAAFSESAKAKIEAAGGKAEVI